MPGGIYCHINAPDEASHMGDIERKVYSIEQIDQYIVRRACNYFQENIEELWGFNYCARPLY